MNKKDERIRKMIDRGVTDSKVIARKLGYTGSALSSGIERVEEAKKRIFKKDEKKN